LIIDHQISFSVVQTSYPFLDFFFLSEDAADVLAPIDFTGWLTNGVRTEDTVPLDLSLENGLDFVWFGLRLLTPFLPIFCSLIGQSTHEGVDLKML